MGKFKLCESRRAANPFFHEMIAVHLYTLEELSYFIETNLFLLDENWVDETLFQWIATELGCIRLAQKLEQVYAGGKDVYDCARLILEEAGCCDRSELASISKIMERMRGKTPMECRKIRADRLLENKKYRQAAYTYLELLQPAYRERMTEELQSNIMHNLGVAYARLFLFREAAEMFAGAYRICERPVSRDAYLYALNYMPDNAPVDDSELEINFGVMREALAKFTQISEDPELFVERRFVSGTGSGANDLPYRGLVARWAEEYREMNA